MNRFFRDQFVWFFSDYQFKFQTYWFKNFIYLFLIVKVIVWLAFYDLYFGEHAIVYTRHFSMNTLRDYAFLLYVNSSAMAGYAFLVPLIILCLFSLIVKRQYFIADFLTWFLVINLSNRVYPALTGGDFLLNQFLLFNCFLSASFSVKTQWFSELKICLHNLAVIAVIVQVCLVYFLSALAKCNDAGWMSGNAIKEITAVNHFNMYSFTGTPAAFNFVFIFINYLIVLYQLVFPVLIWFKKIKRPFIWIGILMHIYIALVMGLVEFGCIMIGAYIYFWPFKKTTI